MSTKNEVFGPLVEQGVIGGIRWAYASAVSRTLDDFSEAAGHDSTWLGNTRFTLMRDRLDRVFGCGRYQLPLDDPNTSSGLDILHAELTLNDRSSLPTIPHGLVSRQDLNSSPGWAMGSFRFLLASGKFGQLESLPWPRKSATKQRVAMQSDPEPPLDLFDDLDPAEAETFRQVSAAGQELDLETFVVAHSLDPVSTDVGLIFGRPRLNSHGGSAWYWQEDIWGHLPSPGGRRNDDPLPVEPDAVPDAQVRLRPREGMNGTESAR